MRIAVSYEIVTDESAEHGDSTERGWEDEEGTEFDDIHEALDWLERQGPLTPSSSEFTDRVWYTGQVIQDRAFFEKGESRTLSYFLRDETEEEARIVWEGVVKGVRPPEPAEPSFP